MVCEKINYTMGRYADVLLYMWANDDEFKKKFENSKGVCLKHMKLLLETLPKAMNDKDAGAFLSVFFAKQQKENQIMQIKQ